MRKARGVSKRLEGLWLLWLEGSLLFFSCLIFVGGFARYANRESASWLVTRSLCVFDC